MFPSAVNLSFVFEFALGHHSRCWGDGPCRWAGRSLGWRIVFLGLLGHLVAVLFTFGHAALQIKEATLTVACGVRACLGKMVQLFVGGRGFARKRVRDAAVTLDV